MSEEYVITPGGFRPKSTVHQIASEHILDATGGRIRELDPAGKTVNDFGEFSTKLGDKPLMPGNVRAVNPALQPGAKVPGLASGWITYAGWNNATGKPITLFKTTWKVPPKPATEHGQTIFIFNGIQNSGWIFQPVLQWGPSAAGGGNYWAVASWYVDGSAYHSSLTNVSVGQSLVGVMTETGKTGSNFNYNSIFQGIANSSFNVHNIPELTWCCETLECYGMTVCSDYPNTEKTEMKDIEIKTTGGHPALKWVAVDAHTDCHQHTVVVSDHNPGGEVDLYYKK